MPCNKKRISLWTYFSEEFSNQSQSMRLCDIRPMHTNQNRTSKLINTRTYELRKCCRMKYFNPSRIHSSLSTFFHTHTHTNLCKETEPRNQITFCNWSIVNIPANCRIAYGQKNGDEGRRGTRKGYFIF